MSKSCVQCSRGYFCTQHNHKNSRYFFKTAHNFENVPFEKKCQIQPEENGQERKWAESRAKVGKKSTIEKSSISNSVWNFKFLLSVWKLDESNQRSSKMNWTCEKPSMQKTSLPTEIRNFFLWKILPRWEREKKERKNKFLPRRVSNIDGCRIYEHVALDIIR